MCKIFWIKAKKQRFKNFRVKVLLQKLSKFSEHNKKKKEKI